MEENIILTIIAVIPSYPATPFFKDSYILIISSNVTSCKYIEFRLDCPRYLRGDTDWDLIFRARLGLGGGRVTRFPFGPLNVFVYNSNWAAQVNSQSRPHFEGDYRIWWLTHALLGAIQLAASRSNMIMYLCKMERDTTKFDVVFTLGRFSRNIFVWMLLGPYTRS